MKAPAAIPADRCQRGRDALKILLGGMLGLVVAMGIGRFVYTPILPLMQRDLGLSHAQAGVLAGLNYLGYLAGAIACSCAPQLLRSRSLGLAALLTSILTTLAMGLTTSLHLWALLRLAAGAASALLFILIAAEVGDSLARRGYGHWAGNLYGGIGLGIALSGLLVPPLDRLGGWATAWLGSGLLAALLALLGVALGRRSRRLPWVAPPELGSPQGLRPIALLAFAYFCEGLGYVVSATFLVTIIAGNSQLAPYAGYSWVAVGLAAVPSTLLWPLLARRIGFRCALLAAYAVQGAGIWLSSQATSLAAILFVALSFGATFLGIVALTLAEGRRRLPRNPAQAAAVLTASFGIGQMLGPMVAGRLADIEAGFALPLQLAAGCVALATLLTLVDRRQRQTQEP